LRALAAKWGSRISRPARPAGRDSGPRRDASPGRSFAAPSGERTCSSAERYRTCPRDDLGQQSSLTDPGLTGQQQQLSGPTGGRHQPPVGQRHQVVAADQHRADLPFSRRRCTPRWRLTARCRSLAHVADSKTRPCGAQPHRHPPIRKRAPPARQDRCNDRCVIRSSRRVWI